MANPRIIQNGDEIEVFSAQPIHEEPEELTDAEKKTRGFADALNNTGNEGTISVYRQDGTGKESMTFIKQCPADQYTLEGLLSYLQENHKSGNYRIQLRINGRLKGNQLYSIESPIGNLKEGASSGGDINTLAQLVRDAMNQSSPPQPSRAEQLQELLLYKELFAQPQQPQNDPMQMMTAMMGAMMQMNTMMQDMQGGKKDEEPEGGRVMEMLGTLVGSAMQAGANNHAQNLPRHEPLQPQPQTKGNQPQATQEEIEMFNKLKMGIGQLVKGAEAKHDPATYAELIVDYVPEKHIEEFFSKKESIDHLAKQFPKIEPHKAWFGEVVQHVKAILGHEDSEVADEYTDEEDVIEAEAVETSEDEKAGE